LNKLARWFKLNKLSLNIKKTNYIIFKSKTKSLTHIPDIWIERNQIDTVEFSKFYLYKIFYILYSLIINTTETNILKIML